MNLKDIMTYYLNRSDDEVDDEDLDQYLNKASIKFMNDCFIKWDSYGVLFLNGNDTLEILKHFTILSIQESYKDQLDLDINEENIEDAIIKFDIPSSSELQLNGKEASGDIFAKEVADDLRNKIKEFFAIEIPDYVKFKYKISDRRVTKEEALKRLYKGIGITYCMDQYNSIYKEIFNNDHYLNFILDDLIDNYSTGEDIEKICTIPSEELDDLLDSYFVRKGLEVASSIIVVDK